MHIAAALLTFTLAATDATQSVHLGALETNHIVRPLTAHPAALYAVKLGSAALTTWIVEHERKQGRTKTAWLLWIGVNAAQGVVVWHNARTR
jgi:hypothetical protein